MTATADTWRRLRATVTGYRRRQSRRSTGDLAYAVYVGVLLVVATLFPVVRAVVVELGDSSASPALVGDQAQQVVAGTLAVVTLATLSVATVVGPVLLTPFFVTLRAGTDLPRSRTLLGPFARTVVGLAALLAGITAVVTGALVYGGHVPAGAMVPAVVGAGLFGAALAVAWLAASVLPPRWGRAASGVVLVVGVVGVVAPAALMVTPWGWVAQLWPGTAAGSGVAMVALGVFTVVLLACTPALLARTGIGRLTADADQWRAFEAGVRTGDLATAMAGFRALPTIGRHWQAVTGRNAAFRFARADLIAAARTPERLTTGLVVLCLGLGLAASAPGLPVGWLLGGLAGALVYLGVGVLCDGLRHSAQASGPLPSYGYSDATLQRLHLIWPVAVLMTGALLTSLATVGTGASITAVPWLVALFAVLGRWYDSRKPPLPLALLTPQPTPAGDASALLVAGYQVDAVLLVGIAGAVATALT